MLTSDRIAELVRAQYPNAVIETGESGGMPALRVKADEIVGICALIKESLEMNMDYLMSQTAVDRPEEFEVVYHLYSVSAKHYAVLKVSVDKSTPSLPSVYSVWKAADWQECEIYDMFGIVFEGHPDLRRILTDDDFEGFPLRKDYGIVSECEEKSEQE